MILDYLKSIKGSIGSFHRLSEVDFVLGGQELISSGVYFSHVLYCPGI